MKKNPTFEEMLGRVEAIVTRLEKGDVSLEESIALYSEGAALIGQCSARLETAEQTVVRLQKGPDGEPIEHPFEEETKA